jgi:hypothetical protein
MRRCPMQSNTPLGPDQVNVLLLLLQVHTRIGGMRFAALEAAVTSFASTLGSTPGLARLTRPTHQEKGNICIQIRKGGRRSADSNHSPGIGGNALSLVQLLRSIWIEDISADNRPCGGDLDPFTREGPQGSTNSVGYPP